MIKTREKREEELRKEMKPSIEMASLERLKSPELKNELMEIKERLNKKDYAVGEMRTKVSILESAINDELSKIEENVGEIQIMLYKKAGEFRKPDSVAVEKLTHFVQGGVVTRYEKVGKKLEEMEEKLGEVKRTVQSKFDEVKKHISEFDERIETMKRKVEEYHRMDADEQVKINEETNKSDEEYEKLKKEMEDLTKFLQEDITSMIAEFKKTAEECKEILKGGGYGEGKETV